MLQGDVIVFFNYAVEVRKKVEPGFSQRCTHCDEDALKK